MLDRAGSSVVDPPRIVHPCQDVAVSVLYAIDPFVPLTMMRMLEPNTIAAMGCFVVPPGVSQDDDQTPPDLRDLC
jgi:hypothetical protein